MTKLFKYLMLVIVTMMAVACSKDSDDKSNSDETDIVGIWIDMNFDEDVSFTLCFKSNGTGWMEWSDEDDRYTFAYAIKNERIFFEDEDYNYWTCDYTIKGNKLTIYGNPWGENDDINVLTLIRK